MAIKFKTMKQFMKENYNISKKKARKKKRHNIILQNKWEKKLIRENGNLKIKEIIPKNSFYCYDYYDNGNRKLCQFWYSIEIPEEERDNNIGIIAEGQTFIGGCKLIKQTDNDMGGWGLLWEKCKECGINYR